MSNYKARLARLEQALLQARTTGNARLALTLQELLLSERAKTRGARVAIEEEVSLSPWTVYNPKRASVKMKAELYDTRIELEDKATIAARWANYQQNRI